MLPNEAKDMQWTLKTKKNIIAFDRNEEYQQILEEVAILTKNVVCSYVGCSLAQYFIDNPELDALTVMADTYSEYDDHGGSFNVYTASISFEYGVSSEEIDEEYFEDIAEQFQDAGDGYEYFTALSEVPNENSYEVKGTLRRIDIAELLETEEVSGLDVYKYITAN